jgi:hypothetical protein
MFLNGLVVNKQEIQQQHHENSRHVDDFLNLHQNPKAYSNKNRKELRKKATDFGKQSYFNFVALNQQDMCASKLITENQLFKTIDPYNNDLIKIKAIKKNGQNIDIIHGKTLNTIKFC